MRVGLDLHTLSGLMQGSRTYMANLAARLPTAAPDLEFVYYVPDPDDPAVHALLPEAANVTWRPIPPGRRARLLWPFPQRLRREVDVFHCQYLAPLMPTVPCVVSIHDILHEIMPQHFPRGLGRLMRLCYPYGARRAAEVLTISAFSRDAIVSRYRVPPERVHFAYLGVGEEFAPAAPEARAAARARCGLPEGRYILFVGRMEPRKNLPGLVDAYRLVRKRLGADAPWLVLAGGRDALFASFHDRLLREGGAEGIVFAGSVPQADLPALLSGASVFAYPSFGEGFGLPVIEAMACGAPVVASTAPAVPEVAGDAALFVDPQDPPAIADALCRVLNDPTLAAGLTARGLVRAGAFRWDATVALALEAYRRAGSGAL